MWHDLAVWQLLGVVRPVASLPRLPFRGSPGTDYRSSTGDNQTDDSMTRDTSNTAPTSSPAFPRAPLGPDCGARTGPGTRPGLGPDWGPAPEGSRPQGGSSGN